jgi:hypothetical protein
MIFPEAVDMNGRFQMQGGKNWFLPKEMNANRFFWDSHWLEIWSNHFYSSMGPNGGSVAMDSDEIPQLEFFYRRSKLAQLLVDPWQKNLVQSWKFRSLTRWALPVFC